MSGAHTPGPWTLCDIGDYGDFDGHSRVILAPDTDEHMMMRLAVVQVSPGDYFDEGNANARLIAAAPDLLEALEALVISAANPSPWANDHITAARAAIAKARGEQP